MTQIDLISLALLKLGEKPIAALDENSAAAMLAAAVWDMTIDNLTAAHPWRFATMKYDLTRSASGGFAIPTDVLRIISCSESNFEIIGNEIFTAAENIKIIAIAKKSCEFFPSHFIGVAATKLAMEFCMPLTGDQNLFRTLSGLYELELANAKFIDSSNSPIRGIQNFPLIGVRG
ncbi:MAG: hypothetical protein LBO08_01320 [Rickettsiales bacterium]|jgi:hypothetical protein|nr:hypothetical protein [Rickettsiales bacterium]